MLTSIRGRSVIVTGASKGIGKGIARVFASQGARVLMLARNSAEIERAADEIRDAGGESYALAGDVTSSSDMERMASTAIEQFGSIDILCANAGIYPSARLDEMTQNDWDGVMTANLTGTFLPVRACLESLKNSRNGRIIVTSSITGPITGLPGWSHYGATKAGQLGFVRTAAIELAPHGITVNAVLPGNIMTEGLKDLGPEYIAQMAAAIPIKRLGTVEDIGYAALFLASEEAAFITGQTIVVDGGQVLPESLTALS
ncbi:MAG TPA: 3-oxoacyl-ACP reductase FabG [Terriglobales bacterium]|jgi:3-oxoacyl-[acyl-carrier protein] reductase|nr:3-oxoacyl-ACP reductase FabG [Terriglobales bacterium]